MQKNSPQNNFKQFSSSTRQRLFKDNDIQSLEIPFSAPISSNRLDPTKPHFSSLSSSLQSKLSSSVLDSSLIYQQLWNKFASFISEDYRNNKFPVITYFESLIDSPHSPQQGSFSHSSKTLFT